VLQALSLFFICARSGPPHSLFASACAARCTLRNRASFFWHQSRLLLHHLFAPSIEHAPQKAQVVTADI